MSADEQAGAGRREVAYRVFAAEFDDADYEYTENEDDERAPNYVVTPTGARVNRLFAVGVLTEVERVNEDMLRGRIVDPTGAFVVYAGQYQPDALTALERADTPSFVAVTGKARTFQPEDSDVIYTSIRPESINEVDAATRDRWAVATARHTVDRVATFADALAREERDADLRSVLEVEGVDSGLAAGIPLAIDHYGTTTAYLDAVSEMAKQVAEVVADEREEVDPLDVAPAEGGRAEIGVDTDAGVVAAAAGGNTSTASTSDTGGGATDDAGALGDFEGSTTGTAEADADTETTTETTSTATETASEASDAGSPEPEIEPDGEVETETEVEADAERGATGEAEPGAGSEAETAAPATDEMYEFDEEEREEIEAEFGADFATGSEIGDPGDADIETPESGETESPDEMASTESADIEPESETETEPGEESETLDAEVTEVPEADDDAEAETAEEPPEDVDLEDAVVDVMRDMDSGDGADREAVIERVADEYGASEDDVADAIQDALMSGKCYEPGDDRLKAI